eukprot:scpid97301/ scgid19155/ 
MALGQQQTNTSIGQDTLLHWESLLVIASGDAEAVSLPIISKRITRDLSGDTLVKESLQLSLIVNFNQFLASRCGKSDVELHLYDKSPSPSVGQRKKRKTQGKQVDLLRMLSLATVAKLHNMASKN